MLSLTPTSWLVNLPKPYLMAAIYALIFSGVYTIDHSLFDLALVLIAGAVGYLMRQFGFPFLPLVLGLVPGYLYDTASLRFAYSSLTTPQDRKSTRLNSRN